MEESIGSVELFRGRIINVEKHDVKLIDGSFSTREVVRHAGAVGVLALNGEDVILVRQYRFPVEEYLLEIPAGGLNPGEDPADCARRELLEETGYGILELELMTVLCTSPGFTDERISLYLAEVERVGEPNPDSGEFVETVILPFNQALDTVKSGEISDGKTISALLFFKTILHGRKRQ